LDGTPETLAALDVPDGAEVLGPVPVPGEAEGQRERLLLRVPRSEGSALAMALAAVQAGRSARKLPDPLRVQVDPVELS
jgi:primosomal protein N' (replication factor Y) (superfamily II helicase)